MQVRTLTPDDLPQACALCMDAFMQAVAPTLSAQGIETFTGVSTPGVCRAHAR